MRDSFAMRTTDCEGGEVEQAGMPASMGWIGDGSNASWTVKCRVCGLVVGIEILGGTTSFDGTVTFHAKGTTTDASYRLKPHERVLSAVELNSLLEARDQRVGRLVAVVKGTLRASSLQPGDLDA